MNKISYIIEYLKDGRTPIRALTDELVSKYVEYFDKNEDIIELGAANEYYKSFFSLEFLDRKYIISNIIDSDVILDMTSMNLDDNSVNYFTSFFAIEHLYDYPEFINEVFRTLKPGGRLMISIPFLYCYHAAPDDYFRFSISAIRKMFEKFNILSINAIGNKELNVVEFNMKKSWHKNNNSFLIKLLIRIIYIPFLIIGLNNPPDNDFASAFLCIMEKREVYS